jgi:hypothetical protein
MQNTRHSCQILIKFEFSLIFFFEKYSNIKFHENLSNGAELFHGEIYDKFNSRFEKFCEHAWLGVRKYHKT